MKIEPCEPCEWAGIDSPAEHYVGWDHMPLCDMHFELDKLGRLGNWVNQNVDFSNEGEALPPAGRKTKVDRSEWLTADTVLRTLERDAWHHLRGPGATELRTHYIVNYIIVILQDFGYDTTDLEITLEQVTE